MVDRRGLLALAAGGVALGGCGGSSRPPATSAETLRPLAALKLRGLSLYPPGELRRAEAEHLTALRSVVGSDPAAAATDSLVALEQQQIVAELAALPSLGEPRLRRLVTGMLADDAAHLALLRRRRGEPAAPDAFVTGTGAA